MCHDGDSRPPDPPIRGAVADAGDFHLTSADGTRLMAYGARPARPRGQGVVILPDLRGLHEFYKALANRFARAGVAAVAIDYYGRTLPDGSRDRAFGEMMPLVGRLRPDQVSADVRAASAHLRGGALGPVPAAFTVGFCLGGSYSWLQSAADPGFSGCIGFYGHPADCRKQIGQMRAPLLILAAGVDALTPVTEVDAFDAELTAAGVEHVTKIYQGAPHSFFDRALKDFEAAAEDCWRQVLRFMNSRSEPARCRPA